MQTEVEKLFGQLAALQVKYLDDDVKIPVFVAQGADAVASGPEVRIDDEAQRPAYNANLAAIAVMNTLVEGLADGGYIEKSSEAMRRINAQDEELSVLTMVLTGALNHHDVATSQEFSEMITSVLVTAYYKGKTGNVVYVED